MTPSALSESLVFDAASVLARAGTMGATLHDVSAALWPDSGVAQHGPAGRVLGELRRRGYVAHTPGSSRRRRYALTADGAHYVSNFSVQAASDGAELIAGYGAPRYAPSPPPPPPAFPPAVEAALAAQLTPTPGFAWMTEAQRAMSVRQKTQAVIDACVIDGVFYPGLRDTALTEANRRIDARLRTAA